MGAQVGGRALELVQAIGAQHALEETLHAARIEAGAVEEGQPDAVGLAFVLARVIELVLDLQRPGGGDGGLRHLAALAAAAARGEDRQGERRERSPLGAALPVDHARLVALQDVRRLVGHHARELVLVLGEEDQPAVDADMAADEREGVHDIVLHHEVIDVAARRIRHREQARADRGDVVGDLRILDVVLVDAHLAHDAVADGAFLLVGKGGGRGIAKIGQGLRPRGQGENQEEGGD